MWDDGFTKACFSVNEYTRDGDITDDGIFLHFGDTKVKVANDIEGFKKFIEHINEMVGEIEENWL